MKALRTITVDGFELVIGIGEPVCDPMASKIRAKKTLGTEATYQQIIAEMVRNPEFFSSVPGEENITNEESEKFEALLHKAKRYERVTREGELVCDNRGRTWHLNTDNAWTKGVIEHVGEGLPEGALWEEDLDLSQMRSIHEHAELEKIAMLSPESRQQAASVEIEATKRAAVIMRMEAEITEEPKGLENARRWYRREVARITKKYDLPEKDDE